MSTAEIVLELILSLPPKDQDMIHESLMGGKKEDKKPKENFDEDPMVDELDALYSKAGL